MSEFKEITLKDEQVDPRIQVELETLNSLAQLINQYELELDEARSQFRQCLSESTSKIDLLGKKLGSCVEKARPYYEARVNGKRLQMETQTATLKFERACSAHLAAKEMVSLAEEGLTRQGRIFDPVWQEMLNHATDRVNQTERERVASEKEHALTSSRYNQEEQLIQKLERKFKRSIVKSRPYYEMKTRFTQTLDEQTKKVKRVEKKLSEAKLNYSNALTRLEEISESIHEKRKLQQHLFELRGVGVGEESPPVCSSPRIERSSQTSPQKMKNTLLNWKALREAKIRALQNIEFDDHEVNILYEANNGINSMEGKDFNISGRDPCTISNQDEHFSDNNPDNSEETDTDEGDSSYHTDGSNDSCYSNSKCNRDNISKFIERDDSHTLKDSLDTLKNININSNRPLIQDINNVKSYNNAIQGHDPSFECNETIDL